MRFLQCLSITVVICWSASSWALTDMQQTPEVKAKAKFVPGQVLLKLAPDISLQKTVKALNAKVVRRVGDGNIVLLNVGAGRAVEKIRELRRQKGVLFAEPNWLRQLHLPNDPGFSYKWDLNNEGSLSDRADRAIIDADMDWLEAYNLLGAGFSGTATIAVIDTGIDPEHPDLDDKITAGYDFLEDDSNPDDTHGHGTHVAGIALAETGNSLGTVGMGYVGGITVMPLRVCNESGCSTSDIIDAIYYATNNGADVINMSLGGSFGSPAEEQAINYAWDNGLVIVASSGNDGVSEVSYPAAFTNAIAVGSTNWHDTLAQYSQTGNALDVVAPGGEMNRYHDLGGIYSTLPTYDVYLTTAYRYSKGYDQLQGTSMAAPQVAGLAGLLLAANPSLSNSDVRSIIETTADDLGDNGWDLEFGWGRINAYNALLLAAFQTLSVTVSGEGTVHSTPGTDMLCTDNCSQDYLLNTVVTLYADPAYNYSFAGWTGDCSGTGDCMVTMDVAKSVTATYLKIINDPVIIEGLQNSFTTIQQAYDSIASGQFAKIKIKAGDQVPGDLMFDRDVTISLEGGYDHIFTNIIGDTSFYGTLTITGGSVTVSNLIIK